MIASVIVWVAVAAILLIVLVARIVSEQRRAAMHNHFHRRHHRLKPIELGSEREEFYITGDSDLIPGDDYDLYYNS